VPGGTIILGGILRDEAAQLRAAARTAGLEPEDERAEDEWWCAVLRRPG
jgi:ribosomal protein L11 methylase PrmA